MKTSNRKKIIIGYRYDPSTNSIDRLHQLQAVDDSAQIYTQTKQSGAIKALPESDLVRTLRNQSNFYLSEDLLLKAQIEHLQQKSSFRSYKLLTQEHEKLQKECLQLKNQIDTLKEKLFEAENKCKALKVEKSTKHSSEQIHQIERNEAWKYTFSPYHNLNSEEILSKSQKSDKELSQKSAHFPSEKQMIALRTPPQMNESFVNKLVSEKFIQSDDLKSTSFGQLNSQQIVHFRNYESLQRQVFGNFSPQSYFQGINSEYLYNDLRTIESEKSQQLESMVQLDVNFSFMPKPLKKNQPSMKILSSPGKKVSFNEDMNLLYPSKDFSFSNKSVGESQNISHPSLGASMNEEQSIKTLTNGLSGLKKLPEKPTRVEARSSDSIRDQQ